MMEAASKGCAHRRVTQNKAISGVDGISGTRILWLGYSKVYNVRQITKNEIYW